MKNEKKVKFSGKISRLNPYLDENGIIKVGRKLEKIDISNVCKHPMLMPKDCHVSKFIILWCHQKTVHSGRGMTLFHSNLLTTKSKVVMSSPGSFGPAYLLSQTLEKNTTHGERIFGKTAQGVHSDITSMTIVQMETKKLSERRGCSSEN